MIDIKVGDTVTIIMTGSAHGTITAVDETRFQFRTSPNWFGGNAWFPRELLYYSSQYDLNWFRLDRDKFSDKKDVLCVELSKLYELSKM